MKFLFVVIFLVGCAHSLDDMICREACARRAIETGHSFDLTAWRAEPRTCGCRFDDGKIVFTRELPPMSERYQ